MKKLLFLTFISILGLGAKAQQVDQAEEIKSQLNDEQRSQIEQADADTKLADEKIGQSAKIYQNIQNLENKARTQKKGKAKKTLKQVATLKTNAHNVDIAAYDIYTKANTVYFSIYTENLNSLGENATDKNRSLVETAVSDADQLFSEALDLLKKVPTGKKADQNQVWSYKKDANAKQNDAVSQLIQAYGTYLWYNKEEQTVTSVVETPQPQPEAPKDKIIYKIQIAASYVPLSLQTLRKIYPSKDIINNELEGDVYKYSIGFYTSYEDACKAKESMNVAGAFVVAYKNGQRVSDISRIVD